jgi:hypothetical protein
MWERARAAEALRTRAFCGVCKQAFLALMWLVSRKETLVIPGNTRPRELL